MRSISLLTCSALLASTASPVSAREVATIEPTTAWQLDMGENKCRIARLFGDPEAPTVFYLEQWEPSDHAIWAVASPGLETFKDGRDARFAFGPGGDTRQFKFFAGEYGDIGKLASGMTALAGPAAMSANTKQIDAVVVPDWQKNPRGLPHMDDTAAEGVDRLEISQGDSEAVVLRLGDMGPVVKALNACTANLVEYWGFDVEQQRTVASPPEITNMNRVVRSVVSRYPDKAERAGEEADFHLRINVDETGAVSECKLVNQTLAEGFDMSRHPCTSFTHVARIKPALTVSGQPVRSYYTVRIAYRMVR